MSIHRSRVIYFPSGESVNPYVLLMKNAINNLGYDVITPKQWCLSINALRRDILFVNWIEDGFISKRGEINYIRYFSTLTFFLFSSCFCKVVWLKHNHKPHVEPCLLGRGMRAFLVFLLKVRSERRAVHSERYAVENGFSFVPHPVSVKLKPTILEYKYFGVIVGSILPYKKHLEILGSWPVDKTLLIVGSAPDKQYLDEIDLLIEERGLDVTVLAEQVSENFLATVVNQSVCVVANASSRASIVSGTTYYGMGFGKPLLLYIDDGGRFHDFSKILYPGVFEFSSEADFIVNEGHLLNINEAELIQAAQKNFGSVAVEKSLEKIIE